MIVTLKTFPPHNYTEDNGADKGAKLASEGEDIMPYQYDKHVKVFLFYRCSYAMCYCQEERCVCVQLILGVCINSNIRFVEGGHIS